MAIPSRRAGAVRLRTAVDAYRVEQKDKLDTQALALLDRLAGSRDAANAFERLKLKDGANAYILQACINAEIVAHKFPEWVELTNAEAKDMIARAGELNEAVAKLRKFVAEVVEQKIKLPSGLWLWAFTDAHVAMTLSLNRIADVVEILPSLGVKFEHIGATRNTGHKEAPNNAAIWWLAKVIRNVGKPHWREVADLAQVILGIAVTENRVRYVVRKRDELYGAMWERQRRCKKANPIRHR